MDAKLLSPRFPHTVIVSCTDEMLPDRLSHAWRLGSCGEDWTWGRAGADQMRFSFKRERDRAQFRLYALADVTAPTG
ncbi:hypothetical protein LNAOJCKE_5251 [Methylorubrum aminovorans]|uniref:Uncharacterized protein n=1 Tax=Methylorubrum aminovorans TaxID=269069 RepID=A0ABQ4UQG9_9HYPH|nr:hypothetical protein [Methylorubrum aminovorans]GJE68015.1 hypothetical protein LNAOJCKE_5251 [Methylorubrum aminovorans]GMA79941.1 hypothetical protein GCM10025880_63580 [Methylorubrum aminovorans]